MMEPLKKLMEPLKKLGAAAIVAAASIAGQAPDAEAGMIEYVAQGGATTFTVDDPNNIVGASVILGNMLYVTPENFDLSVLSFTETIDVSEDGSFSSSININTNDGPGDQVDLSGLVFATANIETDVVAFEGAIGVEVDDLDFTGDLSLAVDAVYGDTFSFLKDKTVQDLADAGVTRLVVENTVVDNGGEQVRGPSTLTVTTSTVIPDPATVVPMALGGGLALLMRRRQRGE